VSERERKEEMEEREGKREDKEGKKSLPHLTPLGLRPTFGKPWVRQTVLVG
jgi:hypothetical protein